MKINIDRIRERIGEYRKSKKGKEASTHLVALDMTIGLFELGIREGRPISEEEKNWLRAGYHLSYIFPSGSEFEDILLVYNQIVSKIEQSNYFRK